MSKLKLYVWDAYGCGYTCGVAYAMAESVKEAREMIREVEDCVDEEALAAEPNIYKGKTAFASWGD